MGAAMNIRSVSRAHYEGSNSKLSHAVTILVDRGGNHMVVLVAGENACGSARGRWMGGLFHGDLPRQSDLDYIRKRFGLHGRDASRASLLTWNRLYKDALEQVASEYQKTETTR